MTESLDLCPASHHGETARNVVCVCAHPPEIFAAHRTLGTNRVRFNDGSLPRPSRQNAALIIRERAQVADAADHLEDKGLGTFFQFAHPAVRSEEHTSELQSLRHLVCRLL